MFQSACKSIIGLHLMVAAIVLIHLQPVFAQGNSGRQVRTPQARPAVPRAPAKSASAAQTPVRRVARILWQDRDTAALQWGDVFSGGTWTLKPSAVPGFPQLNPEQQDLAQMEQAEGMLLVGVGDREQGESRSGWIAVDTGVREEPHGNHSHWKFVSSPRVRLSQLDAKQGNPAHLYVYQGAFYLANDRLNGFTRLLPQELTAARPGAGRFFPGGGGHITLAAVDNVVAYSTWIDREGPNAGRVDVVNLRRSGGESLAYTLTLASGGIHGATSNSGRVFFAPSDGICWVDADTALKQTASGVQMNHLSLGSDPETEKPLRTAAFTNHRNWVLFTTGSGDTAALCLVDAKATRPSVKRVGIPIQDGLSLVTPKAVLVAGGKRYAFVFQDRSEGLGPEYLTIVNLDPNGDRDLSDATVVKTIPVAASRVDRHHGHHSIGFDSEGKLAFLTNPGDGSIWVLSLLDLEVKARLKVGGTPSAVIALGAAEHKH